MPNPTIVSAALNDEELRKSITKLVADYKNSLDDMKTATTNAVKDIQETIKSIGSTKVDFSGTLDGLEKAKKKMTAAASGGGSTTPTKSSYDPGTLGYQENLLKVEEERRKNMKMGTAELQQQNVLIERMSQRIKAEKETNKQATEKYFTKQMQGAISMPTKEIADAEAKLQRLVSLQNTLRGRGIFDETKMNRLQNAIDNVKNKIERLRSKKPMTMQEVLGMDESSIEAIARKMQALKRVTIDPSNAAQVKQLGEEYTRLGKKQNEYLGKNLLIQKSNHMLASTFGYIRNRIIYAFTLGALASFFRDLRNIRAEYEMLDRSLGILVGDFEKGTRIFNELNEMALKSPFTLIELGTAAKQLTAYNFAANEVVDTTRRIADISAALGVPIERLVYNLGQIKAQGSLTARDARDFANAGLAIVPMLADMYTKQKAFGKELTTTADVYDMMSKKMVSYGDVLKVIQQVTDEGGKFFNFQARQADTLKVQIANLSLAYNNMMNDIGASNQGLLSGSIQMVRSLFQNWRTVVKVIEQLIVTFGTYKVVATAVTLLNSRMFVGGILVNLRNYIAGIKAATGAMATFNAVTKMNPIAFLATALATVVGYFLIFKDNVEEVSQEVEMFGESASKTLKKIDTLKKILDGTSDASSTYKKTLSELSNVMSEYGVKLDAEKANRDEINKATEQTIQLIKEEAAERQRANNIAKGEENYNKGIKDAKDAFYSEISDISDLTDIGGQTKKFRKELEDNAQAISDVVATIVEDNISLVVGKSGDEATKGMLEIQEKVSGAMSSMGISSKATQYLLYNTDILWDLIKQTRKVSEEQLNYNNKIDSYYDAAKKATESTMTFTQKVEANARALQNTSNDALSLYNKIYDIVKIAQQNHTINFDLKLTADNPPKWMLDKSLPELQKLAQRFAAIAESGGRVKGYDREGTYQQALRYASAARQKQEEAERAARMKNNTKTKKEKDEILDAIKEEISLTKKLQGEYDKLTSKGASHANAIKDVQQRYENTIKLLDKDLGKFGLPKFDTNIITGKDPNKQLEYFKNLRDILESKGLLNLDRAKVVDAVIQELDVSAKTFNLDKITKGLNNELDRLKEEYELAVALDADPELGSMFASYMGINLDELPRNAEQAAKKAQEYIDKILAENNSKENIDINSLMDKKAFDNWVETSGHNLEDGLVKVISAIRAYLIKVRTDETKNITQDWDKLLEKYAEYETKISKIQNDAVKERVAFAQKFGSEDDKSLALNLQTKILAATDPQEKQKLIEQLKELIKSIAGDDKAKINIVTAIDNSQDQGIAKTNFEQFQKSPEWITATGELSGMTNKAINGLIASLEKYKKSAKNLDPKQIKNINNALKNLYKEQRKNNPFGAIANMIDEAKERLATVQPELDSIKAKMEAVKNEIGDKKPTQEQIKTLDELKEQFETLSEVGEISAGEWVASLMSVYGAIKGAIGLVDDLAKAIGGKEGSDIERVFGVLDKAGQGAQIGAAFGGYGAAIGAVAGAATGFINEFYDEFTGDSSINTNVKDSTINVKRLQTALKDLEYEIEKVGGTGELTLRKSAIASKEWQLAEMKRQLRLEESRDSKNRDEERIEDLRSQIKEFELDLKRAADEIVNDFLGISSVGDAAENMMGAFISALRSGEDAMASFNASIDDMIANMLKKILTTKILEPRMQEIWDNIQSEIDKRTKSQTEELQAIEEFSQRGLLDLLERGFLEESIGLTPKSWLEGTTEEYKELWEKMYSEYQASTGKSAFDEMGHFTDDFVNWIATSSSDYLGEYKKRLEQELANAWQEGDIKNYAEQLRNISPELQDSIDYVNELIKELGLEESSQQSLSALQQGIQGVTETTAGALEAYMNGVSQQVYYQSEILTQIRDAVVVMDGDVQLGTQAQMLLQLQQSYAVQMAIQTILEGWSSPNGLAVRVEMQ